MPNIWKYVIREYYTMTDFIRLIFMIPFYKNKTSRKQRLV